ncbi:transporter substrate-binding domain-containing protein [Sulfurospirillum arcachonense]|uniref:transporter substrate-binding domain-containing protein n=1 Tax=Sulfurospirillum arcachonense TaxID=57666 RepID=UPI00046A3891|nr:transporter substrate-binding domain-containing protein [Sulfurospirillum arcachonense]
MLKLISALLVTLCLAVPHLVAAEKPLVVGMELQYPPFEMSDKQGNPSGVSVDLAYALGKYLNREVKIENIAWDGLIPSLKTGKIDLIISSMTITKQRAKTIDFSIPYAQSNLAILTNPSSGVKNINDLNQKGKKIAVKKGTTGHVYAGKYLKNADLLVFDKENAAVLEVIQKKADGFLYDQLTIYKNWNKHQNTTVALLKPFQDSPEYWGAAIKKGNTELKTKVDAFIKQAKSDGTFDNLSKKYLTKARATFDKLGVPFFF